MKATRWLVALSLAMAAVCGALTVGLIVGGHSLSRGSQIGYAATLALWSALEAANIVRRLRGGSR